MADHSPHRPTIDGKDATVCLDAAKLNTALLVAIHGTGDQAGCKRPNLARTARQRATWVQEVAVARKGVVAGATSQHDHPHCRRAGSQRQALGEVLSIHNLSIIRQADQSSLNCCRPIVGERDESQPLRSQSHYTRPGRSDRGTGMDEDLDVWELAASLRIALGLLRRQLRLIEEPEDELPMPQLAALAQLERRGPLTASDLARAEQISPQSMGATLKALDERGYLGRSPDTDDRRRTLISVSAAGREAFRNRNQAKFQQLARALAVELTARELKCLNNAVPLLNRIAMRVGEPEN